jgi:hypothetical protein
MRNPLSRRSFVKRGAVTGACITLASSAVVRALSDKPKADAPVLRYAGSTGTTIDIEVCTVTGSDATGAPAGFSIQWMTAKDHAAGSNAWCEARFSAEEAGSRYSLKPGDCATVQIPHKRDSDDFTENHKRDSDDFTKNHKRDDEDAAPCTAPLLVGTAYVFRAFAQGSRSLHRSDFSTTLTCLASAFQIPVNAADPLLLRATASDGSLIDYFGTKDATGHPLSVNLIEIRPSSSDSSVNPLRYLLDSTNRPVRMYNSDGTRFDLSWITTTHVALTVRTADGKTQVNTFIDLSLAPPAAGAPATVMPRPNGATAVASPAASSLESHTVPRAGRHVTLKHIPPVSAAALKAAAATAGGSNVDVEVDGCGGGPSTSAADVYVRVLSTGGVFLGEFPATTVGGGHYVATLPSGIALSVNVGEICDSLATVLDLTCQTLIEQPGAAAYLCVALAAAVASTGIGAPIAAGIAAACAALVAGLELYCLTLNASPVPGAPSLAEMICGSQALNRTFTSDVVLVPLVIALPADVVGSPIQAPGDGPFPNLLVDLGGNTTIRSLTLNPPNPAALESYVATADIFCLPAGTIVTMSIVGTDGYTDSSSTTIQTTEQDGTFMLFVPGAATPGIQDVDTATVVLPTGQTITLDASLVFG